MATFTLRLAHTYEGWSICNVVWLCLVYSYNNVKRWIRTTDYITDALPRNQDDVTCQSVFMQCSKGVSYSWGIMITVNESSVYHVFSLPNGSILVCVHIYAHTIRSCSSYGLHYMFCSPLSVLPCGRSRLPVYVSAISPVWIFAILLSLVHLGTKMNWLDSGVKGSKVKVTLSRRRNPALNAAVQFSFIVASFLSTRLFDLMSVFDLRALPRSLLLSTIDSVCLFVCHTSSNCFFFFVSPWNQAIFGPSFLHVPLYKTFSIFDLGP